MLNRKTLKVFTPHSYQERGANWLIEKSEAVNGGGAALFLDMGLGKTSTVLLAFKRLVDQGKATAMLIVAPKRVAQTTWPNEIGKWLDFIDLSYVVLHGSKKDELLKKKASIYIINYEGLAWLTNQKWAAPDIICFDELTRMKAWTSERVKALKPFLPLFKRRWGLTGTPVPNGLQDLFSQVYMLDLGTRFGRRITKFKDQYFKYNVYSRKLTPLPNAEDEIYTKLADLAFRIDSSDWLELPEILHNTVELELPKTLRNQYNVLRDEFIVELSNSTVINAGSASVLTTKLRQFLSGNVYIDGGVEHVHMVKMQALRDMVDSLDGSPALIGYQYKHEIDMFKVLFPEATFIESSTSGPILQKIVSDWNAGKIPVLFGHPQSIGHGLNLQESGNTVIFYSLDFNLENYLQFIKRVARQGQKHKSVIVHYLVFKGTMDEYVLNVLSGKDTVQNALLDFLTIS
jgi:SNF2 family DNA or RNA helicase